MFEPVDYDLGEMSGALIKVVGVGGGGGNAINHMVANMQQKNAGNMITDDALFNTDEHGKIEFYSVNTDAQALRKSQAQQTVQIGANTTKGLGAGANPNVGRKAAEDDQDAIRKMLEGADMVFIAAGMGGGTGTGAAPIVAKIAKDMGILTVGVVTRPFSFEGRRRSEHAEMGIKFLKQFVDSIVIVPNDKLLTIAEPSTTMVEALRMADEILKHGVQSITELISDNSLINADFADVQTIMRDRGVAHMGIGQGKGENKVKDAVKNAVESPLLETQVAGAKAILLNIAGGQDMGMLDVSEASTLIQNVADQDAIIIFGTSIKEDLKDEMRITVIATGFENRPSNFSDRTELSFDEEIAEVTDSDDAKEVSSESSSIKKIIDEDGDDASDFDVPSFLK